MQSCHGVTNPNNQVARQRWFQRILENFLQEICTFENCNTVYFQCAEEDIICVAINNSNVFILLFIVGYEGESLTKLLHKIQRSSVVMMDRWQIEFSAPETGEEEQGDPIPCNIINNYFSIGVVSLLYHTV